MNAFSLLVFAFLVILSPLAVADFRQDATDAMDAVALAADPGVFERVATFFAQSDASDEEWRIFFDEYYENRSYAPATREFWTAAARAYPALEARWAQFALTCGTAALAARWVGDLPPDRVDEVASILFGLADVAASAAQRYGDHFYALWEAYRGGTPLPVTQALQSGEPAQMAAAIQAALLFAVFADGPQPVTSALSLPPAAVTFYDRFGFFVFDLDALTPPQLASLASLADAIPHDVRHVAALTVPAALGFDPVAAGIYSAGALLPIDPVPMDVLTNPEEFVPRVGEPVAPLFTARAARQFVYAIQAGEFARRPELLWRRNAILQSAGARQEPYLRLTVPAATYHARPDDLLPDLAFLYVIDARALYSEAVELLAIDQDEAMDQFLLLVDLLSESGGAAPMWRTALDGTVYVTPATLGRTMVTHVQPPGPLRVGGAAAIPVELTPITRFAFDGRSWEFSLNVSGGISKRIGRF